jgi:hypothetical protein
MTHTLRTCSVATMSRRSRIALAAIVLAVAATSITSTARADVVFNDGRAGATGTCSTVFGGAQTWMGTNSTTSRTVYVAFYVYSVRNPASSGWTGWYEIPPRSTTAIGNIARRGTGPVAVKAYYGHYNGSQWQYGEEWITFSNINSPYCNV